jgi:DNA-binding beta-propeller fold protein YncE
VALLLNTPSAEAKSRRSFANIDHEPEAMREYVEDFADPRSHAEVDVFTPLETLPATAPHLTSSSLVVVPGASAVAVADGDRGEVAFYSEQDLSPLFTVEVGDKPWQLVAAPDGTVYVSCRGARRVDLIAPGGHTVVARFGVDAEPSGMALSPLADVLYVTHASGSVMALDAFTGEPLFRVELPDEPVAVHAHPDGQRVFVAALLSTRAFELDALTGEVLYAPTLVDHVPGQRPDLVVPAKQTGPQAATAPVEGPQLPDLRQEMVAQADNAGVVASLEPPRPVVPLRPSGSRALALSPSGTRLFIPHELADLGDAFGESVAVVPGGYGGLGATGGPIVSGMTVIHLGTGAPLTASVNSGDFGGQESLAYQSARMISAAVHHPSRSLLFVASLGTDTVMMLNTRRAEPATFNLGAWTTGDGPTGLAFSSDGTTLFVATQFDRRVTAYVLGEWGLGVGDESHVAELGPSPLHPDLIAGRSIFHSSSDEVSVFGLTCASCHPNGRQDKRVWSMHLGPRQTPMLAGRLDGTAPYNWLGSEKSLEDNIRNTVQRLNGFGLPQEKQRVLAAYIRSGLATPDNPHVSHSDALSERQSNGKALFHSEDVGCGGCHQSDASFADATRHEVGTTTATEVQVWKRSLQINDDPHSPRGVLGNTLMALGKAIGNEVPAAPVAYDTPSLVGLFATAPYFHDGSQGSLHELLRNNAAHDNMGSTSHLSEEEMEALVDYLLTL